MLQFYKFVLYYHRINDLFCITLHRKNTLMCHTDRTLTEQICHCMAFILPIEHIIVFGLYVVTQLIFNNIIL